MISALELQQYTAFAQVAIPLGIQAINAVEQFILANRAAGLLEDNGQLDVVIAGCKEHIARIEAEEAAEAAGKVGA